MKVKFILIRASGLVCICTSENNQTNVLLSLCGAISAQRVPYQLKYDYKDSSNWTLTGVRKPTYTFQAVGQENHSSREYTNNYSQC